MNAPPQTRYARSGDVSIAYQLVGEGPVDLVFVMGWVSNIDEFWTEPSWARFLERLASFSRLIVFDKRGTGLSDRVDEAHLPSLEQRMDDVRAVMDAVGSKKAALLGISEGSPMCALFAATYPERTAAFMSFGGFARSIAAADYPWARTEQEQEALIKLVQEGWGAQPVGLEKRIPSRRHDERFRQWWTRYLVRSATPRTAALLLRMNAQIDIRHVLPAIRVPALIMHNGGDLTVPVGSGRYLAERIPGARFIEYSGEDHLPWTTDPEKILDDIQEFLTGTRHAAEVDRVLATVMFADIVKSTERAAEIGDRKWKDLLQNFYGVAKRNLERYRGRVVDTAGDGLLATFDGPARAVRCAQAINGDVPALGLTVRAGVHTGEVEIIGEKVGGIAVHIGARVAAEAAPGEVVVSSTVKDLVAGSGIRFEDRGRRVLKGVPGDWQLFRATA
ncbi:MAG TPA: adenylate/guanylate cyclase domain-containing protein [Burkholderiales bacterium]|nr:adenylate/guanylate cyclase domain-containing protein [Burkholderiales bacterium]